MTDIEAAARRLCELRDEHPDDLAYPPGTFFPADPSLTPSPVKRWEIAAREVEEALRRQQVEQAIRETRDGLTDLVEAGRELAGDDVTDAAKEFFGTEGEQEP